jgi:hypothetical protein
MVSADRMAFTVTVAVLHKWVDDIDGYGKSALPCPSDIDNYGSKVL